MKAIEATQPSFSTVRNSNSVLKYFFEKTLLQFKHELQVLASQWYYYSNEDGTPGTNDVFGLIERSYVGLFNNAIIKCFPNDAVLQEYSVHLGGRQYVRGDYLVKHWDDNKPINILFEAKQRLFDGIDYTPDETRIFLSEFITQGKKYYMAEQKYYLDADTYVSSLVFEWVRYKEHLDKILKWSSLDDGVTDFYCLYHTDGAGLMVYGNLEKQMPTIGATVE
jgi:hypothetical protein